MYCNFCLIIESIKMDIVFLVSYYLIITEYFVDDEAYGGVGVMKELKYPPRETQSIVYAKNKQEVKEKIEEYYLNKSNESYGDITYEIFDIIVSDTII